MLLLEKVYINYLYMYVIRPVYALTNCYFTTNIS